MNKTMSRLLLIVGVFIAALAVFPSCANQAYVPTHETSSPPQVQKEEPSTQDNQEVIPLPATTPVKKIAFVRDFGTYYGMEICTIDSDGNNFERVTKNSSKDMRPAWSPDGTKILFESTREGHNLASIYVMDASGENVTCLTPEAQFCQFPAWSPDGRKIVYCVMKNTAGAGSSGGGGSAYGRLGSFASTSERSTFIPDDILMMDSNGGNKQCLVKGWSPTWYPDSQHITYLSSLQGTWEIYSMNIDGSAINVNNQPTYVGSSYGIRFQAGSFSTLAMSPGGNSVAFDSLNSLNRRDIYVMSLADGKAKSLTSNLKDDSYCPTWSLDGTKIAFTTELGEKVDPSTLQVKKKTAIYIIDSNGNNLTLLVEDGAYPSWQR